MKHDVTEAVSLDQRRNVGPDAQRDHAAMREQLADRRDEADRRSKSARSQRDQAERDETRWANERDRYDQMLSLLGEEPPA